eukprot:Gb_01761 [translate_table: standard]
MNSSKQGRTGIEDKAGKAKPIGAKVVTKADARARRVLCNLENEGVLPAKCRAADDLNEGKSRKQKLLAGRPVPRKFGVNLTNNNGSARASILYRITGGGKWLLASSEPLRSQCGTDEKGNVGLMLASKSKGCPPNAKGVSSISGTTIPLKRKGRVHRGFTATLTARSEAIVGPLDAKAQGQLPDIDEEDNENVLAVVEYVDDIYHFYWDIEVSSIPKVKDRSIAKYESFVLQGIAHFMHNVHQRRKHTTPITISAYCAVWARRFLSSSYMSSQTDINQKMRGILINWLIDIHFKFDLMPETLFLMTNLIDRFLSVHIIKRKDFQLVGITAMLVASKYEELWSPKVKELIEISDNSYTHAEMLSMEKLILNKLRFNLTIPTPYVFMKRFLKAARADKQLEHLSFYLIELCLVEYEALKWKPSMLAACAIYTAQHVLQRMPAWTHLLQKHAHYEESELK